MKHNQKITLAIGLGVVILLNIVLLGWLLTDFFSGPNGPEETVFTIDSCEVTTEVITTMPEESGSEEVSTEDETEPPKQVKLEVPLKDAKKLLHRFALGEGDSQLGYSKGMDGEKIHPEGFAVEDGVVYVFDNANNRILIYEKDQYRNIDLSSFSELRGFLYQNARMVVLGKRQEKGVLAIYRADGSEIMTLELPTYVTERGPVQDVLKLDETSVVLEIKLPSGPNGKYSYDWVDDRMMAEIYAIHPLPLFFTQRLGTEVIGVHENNVYYDRLDKTAYVNEISRESESYHLYTRLDTALHYAEPKKNEYLSSDGRLYVMECFADSVEISEIVLTEEMAEEPEESTQEESIPTETSSEWVEEELQIEDVKTLVRTFSWGKDEGKLGYYEDFQGSSGPNAFVVEDNVIIIMDNVNKRVIKYEDDTCTTINLGIEPYAIKYQNDRIAVFDMERKVTKIYGKEGNDEISIEIPKRLRESGEISQILEVGDTYVVWQVYMRASGSIAAYSYDWIEDRLELVRYLEKTTVTVSSQFVELIGESGDGVYYFYPEMENKVYVVNREKENGRVYTKLDYSEYRSDPRRKGYISSDGRFYIMECFEDRVEISELTLE